MQCVDGQEGEEGGQEREGEDSDQWRSGSCETLGHI